VILQVEEKDSTCLRKSRPEGRGESAKKEEEEKGIRGVGGQKRECRRVQCIGVLYSGLLYCRVQCRAVQCSAGINKARLT
jgi:hypothetical protein